MIGKNFREATKDEEHKGIKGCEKDAGGVRMGIYKNGENTASRTLKGGREAGIPPVCEWRSGWSTDAGFPDFALIPIMTMAKFANLKPFHVRGFALIPIMTMAKSPNRHHRSDGSFALIPIMTMAKLASGFPLLSRALP